jgi:aspartyl-tRNA(Asn)/glutamyl-tRNA(Gln) amidotransferase subunit A
MIDRLESIDQTVKNVASGAIAPRHLVEFCLDRIGRHDEVLQAWVRVDEQPALAEADRLEQMARRGKIRGPLHGIPLGVKDIIDVAGMPTLAGSPTRAQHVATRDAPLVSKLRRAGAIILGKTVTTQFAGFDPPPTRNPWNLEHTPGGSSSGSAAAVAAQMCQAAIGTQTGGSIVRPASYCGIAGLKPTYQAIDTSGVVPLSRTLDHPGPIARYVSDLALLFQVLKQGSQAPTGTQVPLAIPLLRKVEDFFMEEAAANVTAALEPAFTRLQAAIDAENPFRLPQSFETLHRMHRRIMAAEAAHVHRNEFQAAARQFAPCITELISEGLEMPAVEFAAALEHRALFRQTMGQQLNTDTVLVMPATNTIAPPDLTTTGDARFQSPWSYAGLPVVSIPAGKDTQGMPCSLQFVGAPGQDERVLAAAAWSENQLALDWGRPDPGAKRTN